ncbi:protein spt2-like [Mangifera indica]|uniref:protein spt2-like n=1 Tax=Mangifera indica TaxID=29780 RepID=UPI001CF965FA|nr:protein spt2-like [Mangifera indica]XP_044506292.1 protein spt2-like [Mangifera indica]XP_044506300.1 protein spt2-like [Mangifera indica]XP_044506307.1 protein spt2-like [Mangifera indica]
MRAYDRYEAEDYDEYEDEGEEQYEEDGEEGEEEEYEEEEERKPTEEELKILEYRQKLKERHRKNLKRENGSDRASSQGKKNRLPYDNFGSFFGPSQPAISQRVLQESKSILETQHLASRLSNSHRNIGKTSASNNTGSKNGGHHQIRKVNEVQRKVERIKVSRDYSFLSDDSVLPAPKKEPTTRNVPVPNSEARSTNGLPRSKQALGSSGRNVHGAPERKLTSSNGHVHLARDDRKSVSSNSQMPLARGERKIVSPNGQMHSKVGPYRPTSASKPNSTPMDSRRQHSSGNGIGPGRPAGPKPQSSKMPVASMQKRASAPVAKNHLPNAKVPPSKMLPSIQKKHFEQRRGSEEQSRSKTLPRQIVASSKPQINKPFKQISSRAQDPCPKKRPSYSDDEDAEAFSMLRSMLGPRKYTSYDDDDSDMEANFEDIMKEEKRSARIARKEDEEQLRLIEEEEKRERMRKLAKKRKLSH